MYWLGKGLAQLGHEVTLIAHPHSQIPGAELRPVRNQDRADGSWLRLIPGKTDIVHFFNSPTVALPQPVAVTIHGNGRPGQKFHPNTMFVSRSHAANHGSIHFVHNGLDPAEYDFSATRADCAVFLAKAAWKVKNLSGAVRVARSAGLILHVLGSRNWPLNLQKWLPRIRGVHYHGMIGGQQKRDLLARARCLILPVRWHEPFGVAFTEALASGCYVAATPYGALPEIVTPQVGVLSLNASDLIDAVRNPQRFDATACRARVLNGGFTHLDMAKKYLAYYEEILTRGTLLKPGEPPAQTAPGFLANHLLDWEE